MKDKDIKKLAIEFRESSKPLDNAIIKHFNKITYGEDVMPFRRFVEWFFGVKNKGLNLSKNDIKHWKPLFVKMDTFLRLSGDKLFPYPRVILMETLAHRYSDYYRFYGEFEDKFNYYYNQSYLLAKENNIGLHIDGAKVWNAVAYERCGQIDKAAVFYRDAVLNRLSYKDIRMPTLKVQKAFDFFVTNRKLMPSNIKECVLKLEEQNNALAKMVGIDCVISQSKIDKYKSIF